MSNVFEVTEERTFHNGNYGTREDVVFLINGMPALVINFKSTSRGKAVATCASGRHALRQGVADIHNGVYDKKRQQIVAKLPDRFHEQFVQVVLSSAWGHLKELGAAIGLPAKRPGDAKKR